MMYSFRNLENDVSREPVRFVACLNVNNEPNNLCQHFLTPDFIYYPHANYIVPFIQKLNKMGTIENMNHLK